MALAGNKPITVASPIPGVSPEIGGAPATVPGSGSGGDGRELMPASAPASVGVSQTEGGAGGDENAVAGIDRKIKTIQDWMDAEENRPETEEERKKRERRERSKRIIAAFSDGLSALGNLYFTTQYAPNMYDPAKGSHTGAVGAGIERMRAEREKKRDQYMNFSLKLGDLENQRAATLRELEAQQERQRLAREKAQREAKAFQFEESLWPDKQREQAGKATKAEQEAITAQAAANAAPEMQAAKLDTERARRGSYDASAENSRASAAAHGRSNVSEFSAWDEHGNEHKFRTKGAAEAYAKQHGTWNTEDHIEITTTETRRTPTAKPQEKTSTKTKDSGYPRKPGSASPGRGKGYGDDNNRGY